MKKIFLEINSERASWAGYQEANARVENESERNRITLAEP